MDDLCEEDLKARDAFFTAMGNVVAPAWVLAIKIARAALADPRTIPIGLAWVGRFLRRAGGPTALLRGARPLTIVMHRFMDARDVQGAWARIQRGETAPAGSDPESARSERSKPLGPAEGGGLPSLHDASDPGGGGGGGRTREVQERLEACSYGMAQVSPGQ
eukprot:tig00021222_g19368.t1